MSLSSWQRGCNCKKSNCLKLYCECFAGGGRCNERCQCANCRNQVHNHEEIAQAIQTIVKRKQKSSQPTARALETETVTRLASETSSLLPERTKGCSCKKSNCLKLYCECLAAQQLCDHRCHCEGCKNQSETLTDRERAIAGILARNPLAFQPKVANGSHQHLRGCNCRKSGCVKNYCECHQAGVACTSRCACTQCRNTETFVSVKKMLDFAGVQTDTSKRRVTVRPSQCKLAKRPHRASAKHANLSHDMLTPTNASTQKPSALELLSKSAPVGPSKLHVREDSTTADIYSLTSSKRPYSHIKHGYTAEEGIVTPTVSKRKYIRQSLTRVPVSKQLLHTGAAIEVAEEDKGDGGNTTKCPFLLTHISGECEPQQSSDSSDDREPSSPVAADLFCEEDYNEATADDTTNVSSATSGVKTSSPWVAHQNDDVNRDHESPTSLNAVHERAVLDEYSMWLRNMVAK